MAQVRPRAAVLATIGSVAVAAGAYFAWTGGRLAQEIPLRKLLFVDVSGDAPSYWMSMAAPLAVVAGIGVLGALLLSRVVLLIAFLLGAATVGLWSVTDLIESGSVTLGSIGLGAWITAGALLLVLISLIVLRTRGDDEDDLDDALDPEDDDEVRPYSPTSRSYGDDTRIGPGTAAVSPYPHRDDSSSSDYGSDSGGGGL
ncbi:MAG TPA: hypothetical protein VI076_16185 [Actinopolymorphaceae bacterium]